MLFLRNTKIPVSKNTSYSYKQSVIQEKAVKLNSGNDVKRNFSRIPSFLQLYLDKISQIWPFKNLRVLIFVKQNHSAIYLFIYLFIRSYPNSTFNCHNLSGIKLLSRIRLGLSNFREHKFKHSFQDYLNPFCSCWKGEVETSSPSLLHCSNRTTISSPELFEKHSKFPSILLFGDS